MLRCAVASRVAGVSPPIGAPLPPGLAPQEAAGHVPQDHQVLAGRGELRDGRRSYRARLGASGQIVQVRRL